jgi:hypothetical protein
MQLDMNDFMGDRRDTTKRSTMLPSNIDDNDEDDDEDDDYCNPLDALTKRLATGAIKATATTYHKRNEDVSR